MDVTRVVPEARAAVHEAARIYVKHTRPWFVGLLVHGSAVKGDWIAGSSDIDLELYLEPEAFAEGGELPLNLCLSLHRDLSRVDPAPFLYLQCRAVPVARDGEAPLRPGLGPIPGAYHLLLGKLPVPEATEEELLDAAHAALSTPDPASERVVEGLLDHGAGRLAADVRRLCTRVWPTLFQVLACRHGRALEIWRLPKGEAVALLPEQELLGQQIRAFHRSVLAWGSGPQSVDRALAVVSYGLRFVREAREWYRREADAA